MSDLNMPGADADGIMGDEPQGDGIENPPAGGDGGTEPPPPPPD